MEDPQKPLPQDKNAQIWTYEPRQVGRSMVEGEWKEGAAVRADLAKRWLEFRNARIVEMTAIGKRPISLRGYLMGRPSRPLIAGCLLVGHAGGR